MKTLEIPLIEGMEQLSNRELRRSLSEAGAHDTIECVPWPDEYPYKPKVSFDMAHSSTHLCVSFHVRGYDLRAIESHDNGDSYKDSCCEFFVMAPGEREYYNLEVTCAGYVHFGKGTGREGRVMQPNVDKIIRYTTQPRTRLDVSGRICQWSAAMVIPYSALGLQHTPRELLGNLYKCGDETAHPHFLSWAPVDTPTPDFHRPEYFGCFKLV